MKILRYIIFLSILSGIFFVIYRQSDKKGFSKWWISFRMATFIAGILAGLIPSSTEAVEPYGTNTNPSIERSHLGKSGPGSRAKGAAKRDFSQRQAGKTPTSRQLGGGLFADAFTVEPKFPARPGRNGDGLFGRFTPQPTPDPHNPGCAGGPRSLTVLSGQRNSDSSTNYSKTVKFNDGYKAQTGNVHLDHIT